jgi:hypothetical protein
MNVGRYCGHSSKPAANEACCFSNLASHLLLIKLIAFEYLIGPELRHGLEMASEIGEEGKPVIFRPVRN